MIYFLNNLKVYGSKYAKSENKLRMYVCICTYKFPNQMHMCCQQKTSENDQKWNIFITVYT
jgi:hypothetical protein